MITSFKLPDLVLGVNIRADVTGARAAARQLRNAVASEFARAGGLGMGGMGGGAAAAGGGMLAPFLGSALGSMMGSTMGIQRGRMAGAASGKWKMLPPSRAPRAQSLLTGFLGKTLDVKNIYGMSNFRKRYMQDKVMMDAMVFRLVNFTDFIGQGARGIFRRMFTGTATAVGKGTRQGMLSGVRSAMRLWHFLIAGLVVGFIVGGVKKMLGPALHYIRATGTTTGRYGAFSNAAAATPSALKNVSVQFGLMVIELLKLDQALSGFNRILVQLGSAMGWIGQQKWLGRLLAGLQKYNPSQLPVNAFFKMMGRIPTGAGGVDLGTGSGRSARMAGGALEGSVEAYRTINQAMMNYAAQTARNTKQTVDALNKLMERRQAMGVVAG